MLTTAPGNGAAIGGLKVVTAHGWFAARPSGTEDVYKLYAESFRGSDHLRRIQEEAQAIIAERWQESCGDVGNVPKSPDRALSSCGTAENRVECSGHFSSATARRSGA